MTGRLEGKVAFVTGAARGQGRSHAVRLAEEGADIIAVDICEQLPQVTNDGSTPEDLKETIRLVEQLDRRIIATETDVRDLDTLTTAVADGVTQLGRLDIVVANAGIGSSGAVLHEMTPSRWQDTIDINLTGVWHTVKASVPHLIEGGRGGSIALTSSAGGLKGSRNIGHYIAAKHGVIGMMRTLALELGEYNIRVNAICPTQVASPMLLNEWTYRVFCPDLEHPTKEDFAARSQGTHVLPTPWVECVDVSNAILFLASDEGRFITGVPLPVDAGNLIK